MRKVRNKSVIRKIAWSTIRENKKKNFVILLAVLLTSAMFTTVFSVAMSLNESSQDATMRQVGGKSMAGLKQMLPEDFEKIQSDPEVVNASYRIIVGMAVNPQLLETQTEVYYATDENAEATFSKPTEGTMPAEKYDVATSTIVLDKLGIPHELGQKISLELSVGPKTITQEFVLCGFWEGDPVAMAQMCFVSREFCDEAAPTPLVPSLEAEDMYTGYWSIDFDFKSSFDIEGQAEKLLERCGYDAATTGVGINWAYTTSDVDLEFVLIAGGAALLILLSGYLIIYNIFYINVVADIHSYGLLKTVGTTGKQLKRLVRMQGLFFCAIGIPLGLVTGTLAGKGMLPIILGTMTFDKNSYVYSMSPWIYVFSFAFTLVTVLLSCGKPCRIAAKVSPMEAVSYVPRDGSKKKRRKRRRVNPLLMAWSELGRNKKKIVVVVLSLSLSLLLVNGVYAIVHGFDAEQYISNSIVGDISVHDVSMRNFALPVVNMKGVSEADREFLGSLDGVEQSNVYYQNTFAPLPDEVRSFMEQLSGVNPIYQDSLDYYLQSGQMEGGIYGIDAFALEHMTVYDGEVDPEKFAKGGYALVNVQQVLDETENERFIDVYKAGDSIEVEFVDGAKKTYEVMAVAELAYPLTTGRYSLIGMNVYVPAADELEHAEGTGAMYSVLQVDPDKMDAVEAAVKEYVERSDNLSYVSKQTYLDEFYDFVNMFYLVGGALAAVLALIGILNFVNAVVTGMLARRQEFAMMEAVGMTGHQLAAMLVWEGIFYALFTIVFAVIANYAVVGFLVKALAGEIWFFTYRPTVLPILICVPILIGLAAAIPYLAGRSMRKRSVVERMRVAE